MFLFLLMFMSSGVGYIPEKGLLRPGNAGGGTAPRSASPQEGNGGAWPGR